MEPFYDQRDRLTQPTLTSHSPNRGKQRYDVDRSGSQGRPQPRPRPDFNAGRKPPRKGPPGWTHDNELKSRIGKAVEIAITDDLSMLPCKILKVDAYTVLIEAVDEEFNVFQGVLFKSCIKLIRLPVEAPAAE